MEFIRKLAKRKLRVGLTVFGITVGVLALVVMGAMAEKMNLMIGGATRFLTNRIVVAEKGGGGFMGGGMLQSSVAQEVEKVPGVGAVEVAVDLMFDEEGAAFSFGMPDIIQGIDVAQRLHSIEAAPMNIELSFSKGGWWRPGESSKAVLGADISTSKKAKMGDMIKARGHEFKVVGLLNRTLTGPDKMMFIPIEDARAIMVESHPFLESTDISQLVGSIYAVVGPDDDPEVVAGRIHEKLPDLKVFSPGEMRKQIQGASVIFNLVILGSALIALLVGGLSVINTMIMSVTERTHEIGIKKAVGATDAQILREYLIEAAVIGAIGGVLGLGFGSALVSVINNATAASGTTIFAVTARLASGALGFATVLGVAAGYLPARHAARLNPIEAVRQE